MDTLNARPNLLKQANLSSIRRVIKTRVTATRAEIADDTRISSTTVRSLLTEMLDNGEIESVGYDDSSGGRKAERYRLTPNRYFGVAFCTTEEEAHGMLVNVCGEILPEEKFRSTGGNFERAIIEFLDGLMPRYEIKSIGLGGPGIVEGGSFWRRNLDTCELYRDSFGDSLASRYGIPVILENNLKATAIGFGHSYEKNQPGRDGDQTDMAYLYLEKGGVSAGFITGGRVIRGSGNVAGELGLISPDNGATLDTYMTKQMDDEQYSALVVRIISWISGILNPRYVVLTGPNMRKACLGRIADKASELLPRQLFPEILYSPDIWRDYHEGMAYLTAGKMFDEVQFIKE